MLVDLRNVAAAGYANGFTPEPGSPVRSVVVEPAKADDGAPLTRVRVSLSEPVSHHVRSQRNIIFIDFNGDDTAQPAVAHGARSAARSDRQRSARRHGARPASFCAPCAPNRRRGTPASS